MWGLLNSRNLSWVTAFRNPGKRCEELTWLLIIHLISQGLAGNQFYAVEEHAGHKKMINNAKKTVEIWAEQCVLTSLAMYFWKSFFTYY